MKISKVLLSLTSSLIIGCASPPDIWLCRPVSVDSGFCTMTISNKDQIVDDTHPLQTSAGPRTWIDLKLESVVTPIDSIVALKEYIIKVCKKDANCSTDITTYSKKLDSLTP